MENEIKVGEFGLEENTEGMYARTFNGLIGQILDANSDELLNGPELITNEKIYCIERDSIKNVKEELIDLIEVGDYVNGKLINQIDIRKNSAYIYYGNCKTFTNYQIKSVVTHEQFESISYKVKE